MSNACGGLPSQDGKRSVNASVANREAHIWGPYADFWALGGASILLWAMLIFADAFREISPPLGVRLAQFSIVFSLLSVFVNYPHFMISYRFGYGRGAKYVLRHWGALIAVPAAMLLAFGAAFFFFDFDVGSSRPLLAFDSTLGAVGLHLPIRDQGSLGKEILLGSIWLMYFTVGWHYSKQVFGCLMVYAKLKGYAFTSLERNGLKWNLLSIACYQFLYLNRTLLDAGSTIDPRFPGIPIMGIDLPDWLSTVVVTLMGLTTVGALVVFARIVLVQKKALDLNFLVAWLAFLIWWIPIRKLPEFYAMAVPFFHSLQYLLFASKLESSTLGETKLAKPKMVTVVCLSIAAGLAGFELVPAAMDVGLSTSTTQTAWFFMMTCAVFFNVHHFFIDAVVWKFDQREVREAFFPGQRR